MLLKRLLLTGIIWLLSGAVIHAQTAPVAVEAPGLTFATVINGALWIYPVDADAIQVETGAVRDIFDLVWSPDGTLLAYRVLNENFESSLWVTTVDGDPPIKIADNPEAGFPFSFTLTGDHLLYATLSPEEGTYRINLVIAPIRERIAPRVVGSFDYQAGCGGGSSIPADWVYNQETGGLGGYSLILAETPFGIVHSIACSGEGLALMNPETGEDTVIAERLGRVNLSPDRTQAVGIVLRVIMGTGDLLVRNFRVQVVDLATLEVIEVPVTSEPLRVAFGADNASIYYTMKTDSGNLAAAYTAEAIQRLTEVTGYGEMPAYTAGIWRVDLATFEETEVYSGDAYAIARLTPLPDGLIFTQIPNLGAWLEGVVAGQYTSGGPDDGLATVPPTVYRLNDSRVTLLGSGLGQFTVNPASIQTQN